MDRILNFEQENSEIVEWNELLDQNSSFKLLYSLSVMEFLMEGKKEAADDSEEDLEDQLQKEEKTEVKAEEKTEENKSNNNVWRQNFIKFNGF